MYYLFLHHQNLAMSLNVMKDIFVESMNELNE